MSDNQKILFEIYLENGEFKVRAKETADALNNVGTSAKKQEAGFSSLTKVIKTFIGLAIVKQLYDIGKAAVMSAANLEKQNVAFTTMLGSAAKAQELLTKIQAFAASTPFQFNELLEASRKLLAFGVSAEQIESTLRSLGDVAAGLGIPLGELSEIYGKARTQQTLFAEDLNQLAGRGIPIFEELAKVMGVNASQVKKLGSEGKISFGMLEQVFKNMTSAGGQFAGLMEAQSGTLSGKFSNLNDTFEQTGVLLAGSNGTIKNTVGLLGNLLAHYNELLLKEQQDAEYKKEQVGLWKKITATTSDQFDIARMIAELDDKKRSDAELYLMYLGGGVKLTEKEVIALETKLGLDRTINQAMAEYNVMLGESGQLLEKNVRFTGMMEQYNKQILKGFGVVVKEPGTKNNNPIPTGGKSNKKEADYASYYAAIGDEERATAQKIQQSREKDLANLDLIYKEKYAKEKGHKEALMQLEAQHAADREAINRNYEQQLADYRERTRQEEVIKNATAWQQKQAQSLAYYRAQLGFESKAFQGTMMIAKAGMALMNEKNKVLFNIGKAATITNILMSTGEAILKGFTYGPFVGIPYAAMVGTVSGLQIARTAGAKPPESGKLKDSNVAMPSFAVGTYNVPNDMLANIHKGEMIIPKTFSDSVRSGEASIGGGAGIVIYVQGSVVDSQGLLDIVDDAQNQRAALLGATKYTFRSAY